MTTHRIDLSKDHPGSSLVHLRGYYGDDGENESVLAITALFEDSPNFPEQGRVIIGSPKASPLLKGYLADLGGFSCSPDAADRLAGELKAAAAAARRAIGSTDDSKSTIHALWFDSRGCGPDELALEIHPFKADRDGEIPASLGIRVRAAGLVINGAPLVDGGFNLGREQAEQLSREIGEWLQANP